MSTPDEALAAALRDFFDWQSVPDDIIQRDAEAVSAALAASGYAIVRSDELAGLRAVAEAARAYVSTNDDDSPYTAGGAFRDLRSALEGVSR